MTAAQYPYGWVLDSAGALYDVTHGRSSKRLMNVERLVDGLLFREGHPLVFFYRRWGPSDRAPSSVQMETPSIVMARGKDAGVLRSALFRAVYPRSKEPIYWTERFGTPVRYGVFPELHMPTNNVRANYYGQTAIRTMRKASATFVRLSLEVLQQSYSLFSMLDPPATPVLEAMSLVGSTVESRAIVMDVYKTWSEKR